MQHDALLLAQLYMFHPSGSSRAHAHACSRGWTQGGDEGQLVARAQPRAALARGRCSAPGLVTSLHIHFGAGGVLYVAFAGLGLVSQSIMVYALLAEHEFNVLGAVLFHLVISLTSDLSVSLVLGLSLTFMMAYGLIAALVTAVVVIVRRELPFARLAPRGVGSPICLCGLLVCGEDLQGFVQDGITVRSECLAAHLHFHIGWDSHLFIDLAIVGEADLVGQSKTPAVRQ